MQRSTFVLLCLVTLLCFCRESFQGPDHSRLYHDLLKNNNPMERPVMNDSQTLTVKLGINLQQIIEVEEENQVLTTNIWLHVEWEAHNLVWKPEDYAGVQQLRFPNDRIWKPDIMLYNSASERFDTTIHSNILVDNTGSCQYVSPGILQSTCKIDRRWFPFDEQRCKLTFGSWTYRGVELDLEMLYTDLSNYIANGEWDLVEVKGVRTERMYECCPEAYPEITYTMVMKRRTLRYGLSLLLPCLLISTLTLLLFLLPAASGEKISLGIAVLLALFIFMLLVADVAPATSDSVPLIYLFFIATVVIVGLSVITTVLVLQCHHHHPKGSKMPQWARVFLLDWCAWILRIKPPGEGKALSGDLPLKGVAPGPQTHPSNMLCVGVRGQDNSTHSTEAKSDSGVMCGSLLRSGEGEPLVPSSPGLSVGSAVEQELGKILEEVCYIATHFREQHREETLSDEWKFAACVIDRLCLIVYSIFTILCTIGILMST